MESCLRLLFEAGVEGPDLSDINDDWESPFRFLVITNWVASWLFWAGFVKLAGER